MRSKRPLAAVGRRAFVVSSLTGAVGFALGRLMPRPKPEAAPSESADVDILYHLWSQLGGPPRLGPTSDWGEQPQRFKVYPAAQRIKLPDPHGYQGLSLEEAIEARRSTRRYAGVALSLDQLSRLLHAAQGITDKRRGYRAAPSAGALYPIEVYASVRTVTGIEPGIYHYAVREHELELVAAGDVSAAIAHAGLDQAFLGQAGVCFILSAIFQRTRWKYHERAYRYVLLEAGHIGQNLYLAATSMGLGACAVGAFYDAEVNRLFGLDGETEAALHIIAVGKV